MTIQSEVQDGVPEEEGWYFIYIEPWGWIPCEVFGGKFDGRLLAMTREGLVTYEFGEWSEFTWSERIEEPEL